MSLCLVLALFISGTYGFLYDDPCVVYPRYSQSGIPQDPENTIKATVPTKCHNGTIDWDYPKGHLMLHFPNPSGESTSICIRDWLVGTLFTIVDVTDNRNDAISPIKRDSFKCTTSSSSRDIVLKIIAPEELLYMGGFDYLVKK